MSSLPKPITKMLVRELKEELEKRGLDTKGLKAQLAARLKEAVDKEQGQGNAESNGQQGEEKAKGGGGGEEEQVAPPPSEQKISAKKKSDEQKEEQEKAKGGKDGNTKKEKDTPSSATRGGQDSDKKRKTETETEAQKETTKRQRKWSSTSSDIPVVSTDTLKDLAPETSKRVGSNSETPKQSSNNKLPAADKIENTTAENEVREVPPAQKPTSNVLYLTNFVRPFTKQAVAELLNQTGKVVQWDMDDIKSRCYVIYETEEEAVTTRQAVHNLIWPPNNKSKLQVEFATEEEAKQFFSKDTRPVEPKTKPAPVPENVLTLDDLFKKTTAKPPIYWLPLTESEIEAKKKTNQ